LAKETRRRERAKLAGVSAGDEALKALSHRLAELTEGTEEREALLQRLAEQIRSGQYAVDADALAASLAERFESEDPEIQK